MDDARDETRGRKNRFLASILSALLLVMLIGAGAMDVRNRLKVERVVSDAFDSTTTGEASTPALSSFAAGAKGGRFFFRVKGGRTR